MNFVSPRLFGRLSALLLLSFICASSAHAQLTIAQSQADDGLVELSLPAVQDDTGINSVTQAAVQFNRLEQSKQLAAEPAISFATAGETYWVRLVATNNARNENWQLDFLPEISNNASPIKSLALYSSDNPEKPLAASRTTSLPINLKSGETTTRYVLVETWPGLNNHVIPQLKTKSFVDQLAIKMAQKISLLWLIIGIVCGGGLVQLILTRQPVQGMLALNAVLVGCGLFVLQRPDLMASITSTHPILVPLAISCIIASGASLLLWVATSPVSARAPISLIPILLSIGLFALTATNMDMFLAKNFSLEKLPHFILVLTGIILTGTTFIFGLTTASLMWFLPAWVSLALMPWLGTTYPLASGLIYIFLLGIAGVATVYGYWRGMDEETAALQLKLRQELKNIKDKFKEENDNWNKKMDGQRVLLTELKQREQQRSAELELAKREADEASKAKSDFLAIISHEIRTPMNGIMGVLQILEHTHLDRKQSEYIDVIKNSGETMVTLLNDILDYSKIEKGMIQLESIPFSLHKLVESVATLMSGRSKDKGLTINLDIAESVQDVCSGDPGRIRQILLNLVSNAIKFTDHGSVTIRIRKSQDAFSFVVFEIIDTGMGISQESQEKLFQAYAQADASINRRFGGTGLGLNICRMLVTAMQGQIGVDSIEGRGSTFWFSIPLGVANRADLDARKETNLDYKPLKPLHILVIDDNQVNLKIVSSLLEMDGHTTEVALSGDRGLLLVEQERFDVVFVDMLMPNMNGQTFLQRLRRNPDAERAALPVFALTGMADSEAIKEIMNIGMLDVIVKPVSQNSLRGAIDKVFKLQEEGHVDVEDIIGALDTLSEEDKEELRTALEEEKAENPSILNETMLTELKQSLSAEIFVEIFDELIEKAKEITTTIEVNVEAGDYPGLGNSAHNIKGMAGNFGLQGLMSHSGKIESAIREGDHEKAANLAKDSRQILEETITALKGWLETN